MHGLFTWRVWLFAACLTLCARPGWPLGQPSYVTTTPSRASFVLVLAKDAAPIWVDGADWPGVIRAASDLQADIQRVTGVTPAMITAGRPNGRTVVIVGTVGRSPAHRSAGPGAQTRRQRDRGQVGIVLPADGRDREPAAGRVERARHRRQRQARHNLRHLRSVRADRRVAVVLVGRRNARSQGRAVRDGRHTSAGGAERQVSAASSSTTRSRTSTTGSARSSASTRRRAACPDTVANFNRQFYTKVFEVLLRLKANYLWPAMWNNAFTEDDPDNPRLADEYGIVMGTSHQEPMLRAQKEWDWHLRPTLGNWNYATHPDVLEERSGATASARARPSRTSTRSACAARTTPRWCRGRPRAWRCWRGSWRPSGR